MPLSRSQMTKKKTAANTNISTTVKLKAISCNELSLIIKNYTINSILTIIRK